MTKTITRTEWEAAKRNGYTSKNVGPNGYRMMLALEKGTGATVLQEVYVEGMRSPKCY